MKKKVNYVFVFKYLCYYKYYYALADSLSDKAKKRMFLSFYMLK